MLMCLLAYVGFHGQIFSLSIAVGMAGALLAFLYFNFPPAKIYLGDGGAYFLGYLIGGLAIQNSNKGTIAAALIAPIFALALPILDVSFSIFRRGLHGLPIFRPDRRHIHHRLLSAGWSGRRAVLTLYAISLFFLAVAFIAFWSDGRLTAILVGCSFAVLLVVVPSLGLIKNWLTVGTAFGNSLEMRKEIQYALLLRNWLQMEADRCESLLGLWHDFTFAANKLGFREATLTHGNVHCSWASKEPDLPLRSARHELHIAGEAVALHFTAPKAMDEKTFHLLSELAAETWLNAAVRWTKRSKMSFRLPHSNDLDQEPVRSSAPGAAEEFLSA
jgi:UDP-GlcNAc:undecaprenyl-phosphate GlcNAc-1-phosphate transferase